MQSFIISSNIVIFARMKRAIIIGASSGIGREVCLRLLSCGWNVGIAARREDKLMEIRASHPGRVEAMGIDVTADDAPQRLLELAARLGGVDLYVHCSGVGKQNAGLDRDVELATVDVNVRGFTAMVDAIFNYMAAAGGPIGHRIPAALAACPNAPPIVVGTSFGSFAPARRARSRSLRCATSPHRAGRGGGPGLKHQKENGRARSKEKMFGGSVCASADLLPPAGEGWRSLAAVRDGKALPLGSSKPGEVSDTFRSAFCCC